MGEPSQMFRGCTLGATRALGRAASAPGARQGRAGAGAPGEAQIYTVPAEDAVDPAEKPPILLSYVDVVFQGYLREFGTEGLARFIATTDGWEAPILNDRAAPRYPRHQPLGDDERRMFDASLRALDVTIVTL